MVDFKRSILNLSIHARNAFVNPTSQMAFELTRSAKERSTQEFFNRRIACAEVALAAFSQLTNGVLDAARHMLDVPVNILRGQLEDAGRDIVTSLKEGWVLQWLLSQLALY